MQASNIAPVVQQDQSTNNFTDLHSKYKKLKTFTFFLLAVIVFLMGLAGYLVYYINMSTIVEDSTDGNDDVLLSYTENKIRPQTTTIQNQGSGSDYFPNGGDTPRPSN